MSTVAAPSYKEVLPRAVLPFPVGAPYRTSPAPRPLVGPPLVVDDAWQGLGLAGRLSEALVQRALARGVTKFTAPPWVEEP